MSWLRADRVTRPGRLFGAALAVGASALLSACQVDTTVRIAVEDNGSGTVGLRTVLDAEAANELGADPVAAISVDDLRNAGWEVSMRRVEGGGVQVDASKPFSNPRRLGSVIDELSGPAGPLRDWSLSVDSGFATATYRLGGTVELTGSLDQFSDAEVAAALDGFATGRSPDELAAALAAHPDGVTLRVETELPAEITAATGADRSDDEPETASARWVLGDGKPTTAHVRVDASERSQTPVVWMAGGAVAVLAAVAVALSGRGRRRRR